MRHPKAAHPCGREHFLRTHRNVNKYALGFLQNAHVLTNEKRRLAAS